MARRWPWRTLLLLAVALAVDGAFYLLARRPPSCGADNTGDNSGLAQVAVLAWFAAPVGVFAVGMRESARAGLGHARPIAVCGVGLLIVTHISVALAAIGHALGCGFF